MIIPLGLTHAPRGRTPWVSLVMAASCVYLLMNWQPQPEAPASSPLRQFAFTEYWTAHTYLVPPPELVGDVDPKQLLKAVQERDRRRMLGTLPDAATLEREQAKWNSLLGSKPQGGSGYHDWGLVPSRGWKQPGWFTHLFLHGGWMHLVGNLVFFAAVGPVLETLLGPLVFLAFYLLGGLIAGLCQVLLTPHSDIPIVGASGAIAACMGAFTVRFPTDSVRILLFGFIVRRVVSWPVWVWSGLWVVNQVALFWLAGPVSAGVAVAAHIGGFAFGGAVALILRLTRIGQYLPGIPVEQEEPPLLTATDDLAAAEAAAQRNDLLAAIAAYRAALVRRPESVPALWGLTQMLFRTGQAEEASQRFDGVLARWIASDSQLLIRQALATIGRQLDPKRLQPARAGRVAPMLEGIDLPRALTAYEAATQAGSSEACVRLGELRWQLGDGEGAREMLRQFKALDVRTQEAIRRANELSQQIIQALPQVAG
jgi:membrane associated rhomboid family serine protease